VTRAVPLASTLSRLLLDCALGRLEPPGDPR
jgi:hypothetical protein